MKRLKRVFICSRYSGDTEKNVLIAQRICRLAMSSRMGYAPFAPHLIYPQFLNDDVEHEREMGIEAGKAFLHACDEVWVYEADGISAGMEKEIAYAKSIGKPIIKVALEE